jgi:beta-glucanase (GH16 family)
VNNGTLYIAPQFTNLSIGNSGVASADVNLWGGDPATACTDNGFYGCERQGGGGGNVVNPIQSARLRTAETFAFKYGRVEFVARAPKGDWLWPALWLMPVNAAYGTWPASGEVDIFESRGNNASYAAGGCNQFGSTLHFGPFWPEDGYLATHGNYTLPTGDLSQGFHTCELPQHPAARTAVPSPLPPRRRIFLELNGHVHVH